MTLTCASICSRTRHAVQRERPLDRHPERNRRQAPTPVTSVLVNVISGYLSDLEHILLHGLLDLAPVGLLDVVGDGQRSRLDGQFQRGAAGWSSARVTSPEKSRTTIVGLCPNADSIPVGIDLQREPAQRPG